MAGLENGRVPVTAIGSKASFLEILVASDK
jgi:hypothetical protein